VSVKERAPIPMEYGPRNPTLSPPIARRDNAHAEEMAERVVFAHEALRRRVRHLLVDAHRDPEGRDAGGEGGGGMGGRVPMSLQRHTRRQSRTQNIKNKMRRSSSKLRIVHQARAR
jgi:hypothetical protein